MKCALISKELDAKTMNPKIIKAKRDQRYISEIFSKLPYGMIYKGETGCGATTLPIESKDNVIICVPLNRLIENKVEQYPNKRCDYHLQGVYSGITDEEIQDHLKLDQPNKFIVTYDSFIRLRNLIGDISDYHIIIDEYSELLDIYLSREQNIEPFINEIKDYENISYISATPLPDLLLPDFLKGKDIYKIDWSESKHYNKVKTIFLSESNKPIVTTKNLILNFMSNKVIVNNKRPDELFIFVNSVDIIVSIVKETGLPERSFNVICGRSPENESKLKAIESGIGDFKQNKKINFVTKTGFLGCDFYSRNGLKVIVTNVYKQYTKLDVNRDIMQINGRIRNTNNPFNDTMIHITNFDYQNDKDKAKELIRQKRDMSLKICREYQKETESIQNYYLKKIKEDNLYVKYNRKNNTVSFDDMKYKAEIANYLTYKVDYLNPEKLMNQYNNSNLKSNSFVVKEDEKIKSYFKSKTKKDYYELYNEIRENQFDFSRMFFDKKYIAIPDQVDILGIEKIRSLKYSESKIKTEMMFESREFQEAVISDLQTTIKPNDQRTTEDIKSLLQRIYDRLGMDKKATAKDIFRYWKNVIEKRIGSKNVFLFM
ncbi:hypothetical protein SAMN05216357_13510 [Porphyromonadaceae bacterium KH3CP3RA]|nr:hypothetical protein SAMN05216357_13510 [Porphyromonadaceae bacterium KH3CP3RA]